jgi:predicted nuclease of restriction endonuclease-like (RecB) superfamily
MGKKDEKMNKSSLRLHTTITEDIKRLITESQNSVATKVNSELTMLYWKIGKRINQELLQNQRADYGKQILSTLSTELRTEFGQGFSERNLYRMVKFNNFFSDDTILPTLSAKLSWSHIVELLSIKDTLEREFYTTMCIESNWSVRKFKERKDSMLFERTALSRESDELIQEELEQSKNSELSEKLILKDPYILDFLQLNDRYYERDLEDAVLRELEQFLLELGAGFTFVERQKRIQIDDEDFYIDLLFYNRKLKRLVAIELKLGDFRAAYKGQMELYLRWLDKYETENGEKQPLGIILCSGKKHQQIELLELDKSDIHVAEYLTVLPERRVLENKLKQAIDNAKRKSQVNVEEN